MRYFNTKTKAVIESKLNLVGGNWIPEEDLNVENNTTDDEKTENLENEEIHNDEDHGESNEKSDKESNDLNDITVKDIKQELDAQGIEYNPKAKKQELYDLMMQGK